MIKVGRSLHTSLDVDYSVACLIASCTIIFLCKNFTAASAYSKDAMDISVCADTSSGHIGARKWPALSAD